MNNSIEVIQNKERKDYYDFMSDSLYEKDECLGSEVFVDVKGFEGYYQVSNYGRVRSVDRVIIHKNGAVFNCEGVVLKGSKNTSGYICFCFTVNRKRITKDAHKLVAIHFLNHVPSGMKNVVDHIDGNKLNNKASNLQVISHRRNVLKGGITKNKTSIYPGVSFSKTNNKWRVRLLVDKKNVHMGYFTSEKEAYRVYVDKIKEIETLNTGNR